MVNKEYSKILFKRESEEKLPLLKRIGVAGLPKFLVKCGNEEELLQLKRIGVAALPYVAEWVENNIRWAQYRFPVYAYVVILPSYEIMLYEIDTKFPVHIPPEFRPVLITCADFVAEYNVS